MPPSAANESAQLPPSLPSGAARAHAMLIQAQGEGDLQQVLAIVKLAAAELARYIPAHLHAPAAAEAREVVSREL